jgi:hypothetical protein
MIDENISTALKKSILFDKPIHSGDLLKINNLNNYDFFNVFNEYKIHQIDNFLHKMQRSKIEYEEMNEQKNVKITDSMLSRLQELFPATLDNSIESTYRQEINKKGIKRFAKLNRSL